MARLIDAEALKDLLIETLEHIAKKPTMTGQEIHIVAGCHMLCEMIVDAPTIDAVPVVRCKECAYRFSAYCPMRHEEYRYTEDDGMDYYTVDYTTDDGFCHEGAKMDGGAADG